MTRLAPRCGERLRRKEQGGVPVLPDERPVCGRRAGHPGHHMSTKALDRQRQRRSRQAPSGSPVIGAAVRQARERAGMSQRHLAEVLGVSQTAVQHWEYGKRTPAAENRGRLELALGPVLQESRDHAAA